MTRPLVVIALLMSLGGCATQRHVQLAALPKPGAPVDERKAYYEAHRPFAIRPPSNMNRVPVVILEDGTRVDDPIDLLPTLSPRSETAIRLERGADAADARDGWAIAGGALLTSGLFATSLAGGTLLAAGVEPTVSLDPVTFAGVFGVLVLGFGANIAGITSLVVVSFEEKGAASETAAALRGYDRDLKKRLALDDSDVGEQPRGVAYASPNGSIDFLHTLETKP